MNTTPLSELSRPRTLDDVVGQEEAILKLRGYLDAPDETPHMILSGPPGCGKTSTILAWSRYVYGPKHSDIGRSVGNSYPVRMLNMSALRSVKDVLNRIHETCQYIHDTSRSKASRGIIICDEADSLTAESQEVLVYCMRKYRERWIFTLVMNYPSRMGERVWNECVHIPFLPLKEIQPIVESTIRNAKLGRKIPKKHISTLMDVYSGDLRRILNASQGVNHMGEGFIPEWKRWTSVSVRDKTPSGVYQHLHEKCHQDGGAEENRVYLGLALALHRPGSLRPILAAIQEHHCD